MDHVASGVSRLQTAMWDPPTSDCVCASTKSLWKSHRHSAGSVLVANLNMITLLENLSYAVLGSDRMTAGLYIRHGDLSRQVNGLLCPLVVTGSLGSQFWLVFIAQ